MAGPSDDQLPTITITDAGTAVSGNPYAGPFLAPLPILETAQPFIPITRACSIVDAVCFVTASGAATAQPHYLLVCKNSIQNVIGYLTSGLLQPNSAQRHALALKFKPGDTCFFKSVTGSAVVEAVTWQLLFA